MDTGKRKIIQLFNKKVKGRKADLSKYQGKHDGKEGHWLEAQMNIKPNASNLPDLYGYEMKKSTKGKTTFGDWSANYYIFNDKKYKITRDDFLQIFGKANVKKKSRFYWSGEPCPSFKCHNSFGQRLFVDKDKNILVRYSYSKDQRKNKKKIVPVNMQVERLVIARWDVDSIKKKVESKFNDKGWFRCLKNADGIYTGIVFGDPLDFKKWIQGVEAGEIFFDSGMYQGNVRPYSQWRANNSYWDNLITSTY
ncbi:LlaMI family restriction endonuclease [Candidatus Uhrbacteria bacterium]|nr:LlaMI family restriction endonuclease [Candidatus Uhrbacteria bacterium]